MGSGARCGGGRERIYAEETDALVTQITAFGAALVVLEATGRYEAPCAAALAAARSNLPVRALCERLFGRDKPKEGRPLACARKLLVTCNEVVHDGRAREANLAVVA